MTEAGGPTVRIVLDLVPDSEPIEGWARGANGVPRAFAGWLELVDVLDRARQSQSPGSAERSTNRRGEQQ
ncbi:MAG TPA: hypothetical protein VF444_09865 [Pseudonocardiaceae bacterium]